MKIAKFDFVSKKQFDEDLKKILNIDDCNYADLILPKRATKYSAGYDFYAPFDVCLKPHESIKIPSGIRCKIDNKYVLMLFPRSSLGMKYHMSLLNTVGVIDSDYYYADNEGHIIISIINNSEKNLIINKGDRFVQGIFFAYFLADEEENNTLRHGGFGSTN